MRKLAYTASVLLGAAAVVGVVFYIFWAEERDLKRSEQSIRHAGFQVVRIRNFDDEVWVKQCGGVIKLWYQGNANNALPLQYRYNGASYPDIQSPEDLIGALEHAGFQC